MANIFYGIPSENNINRNIKKWIDIAGHPDVFAEKDENLQKYPSKILEKYDVVSIDKALKIYPDAEVWVTYRSAGNTAKMLLTKFPPSKIHFFEADLEYRKGCTYLGYFISYRKDNFSPCCVTGRCPVVKTSGTIRQRLEYWQNYTEKLVDDIRGERTNACEKCHLLKYGFWQKSVKLREISFGSNNPGDVCNFKCTYCFSESSLNRLKNDKDGFTTYEVLRQLSEMPEYDSEDFIIQLSNGEFSVNKHCEEMLDILLKTKWKISMVTNLSVYREKLATLMENGRLNKLLVSIDAGTRETFKKIKKNDRFDKVVENLKKYPTDNARLLLKYIFLEGVNDNETDVDGFYEIVKEVGCKTIILSGDQRLNFMPLTDKMRELTLRIIKKAKTDGIKISSNSSYLNPADAKFIAENYDNTFVVREIDNIAFEDGLIIYSKKKVSVVIPTYNTLPDYLDKCLSSVCNQTMSTDDYEILIIDDSSTNEKTLDVIKNYTKKFPHLIVFEQLEKNSGTASTPRNRGINMACGEYILFVDSDDYIGAETLERMYNWGKTNNADSITGKHDDTQREKPLGFVKDGNLGDANIFLSKLAAQGNILRMFKREILIRYKIFFDPNLKKREDLLFLTAFFANSALHSTITDYTCYFSTKHDGPHLSRYSPSIDEYLYLIKKTIEYVYQGITGDSNFKDHLAAIRLDLIFSIKTVFGYFINASASIDETSKQKYLKILSDIFNDLLPQSAEAYVNTAYKAIFFAIRQNDLKLLQANITEFNAIKSN